MKTTAYDIKSVFASYSVSRTVVRYDTAMLLTVSM